MKIQMIGERMKHVAFAVRGAAFIASLALTPGAGAQTSGADPRSAQGPASSKMIERRVAMLTSHLQLYSGQATKIRAILTQEREQITTLRDNASDSRPARSGPGPRSARIAPPPEARAITDHTELEIEKVLNTRQLAAYRALKEGKRLPNYLQQTRRGGFAA
jgi:hypothetical protein